MANKIPVGATIARAYGFAFGNILNNLGAIWVPVAIVWAASFFFYRPYMEHALQAGSGDPQAMLHSMRFVGVGFLLTFLLLTAQIAALTKEALGLRAGNAFLQFPFGPAMWRLLANYVLFILAMLVIYVIVAIAAIVGGIVLGVVAGQAAAPAGKPIVALAIAALAIAVSCALIYIATRLSFLLAPVAVAEQRITLIRGWELTRGNFWRIFLIVLSVLLPLLLLEIVYILALYGTDFFPRPGTLGSPEGMAQWQQHNRQLSLHGMEVTQRYWFIVYPLGLLFALIVYALFAGLSAFAYRALVPESPAVVEEAPQ